MNCERFSLQNKDVKATKAPKNGSTTEVLSTTDYSQTISSLDVAFSCIVERPNISGLGTS